jgi:tetratricopeptide (TPR) repeat protein
MYEEGSYQEEEFGEALKRFKKSLISGRKNYFDVSEFEGIVDQLLEEGDIKTSKIAAKQGIQIHPNAVTLQMKYAQVLLNEGEHSKARKYLELAEKIEKENPDIHLLKGSSWLTEGNEIEAQKSFKKAIKYAGSDLDEIYHHIGSAYIYINYIGKGVSYFKKAVKENPRNNTALYDMAFFSDQCGNYNDSIKYYNILIDNDPYNETAWFNLGVVYNKLENTEKSIDAYEYALAINENFGLAIFNLGNALCNATRFTEAIEQYNAYLKLDPENDNAYCCLGECYLNLNDYDTSEANYKTATELDEDNDTAWFGLGLIMWIKQDFEESIKQIKKALKLDDSNSEYWLTLGKVYFDSRNSKNAFQALKKGTRLDPENTEIWLTWSEFLKENNEIEEAIKVLKKALKKTDNSIVHYRLVAMLFECRKYNNALDELYFALSEYPDEMFYLFDFYPNAKKSKRVQKLIDSFFNEPMNPDAPF